MIIQWCKDFELGIPLIDEQHKRFILIINRLDAVRNSKNHTETLEKIFLELINYCNYHFTTEENAMEKNLFSRLELHKTLHDNFLKKIHGFYLKIKKKDNTFVLSDTMNCLSDWLVDHIMAEDRQYILAVSDWFIQKSQLKTITARSS